MRNPFAVFAVLAGLAVGGALRGATPVERHGLLRVEGAKIVGGDGKPASLAGLSFFWSQWMGDFWNTECVRWLQQDWNATIVRAAMGVEEGGYLSDPAAERRKVERVVDAAIAAGMYVIVDWHDHHAERNATEAAAFFRSIAEKYGRYPNIVYEIYNEPLSVSWRNVVKPYAETVIAAIRAADPDNLIVVGTPHWSQDVDVAAADPIADGNVAYALHFYAGTHKQALRDKAERALQKGVALFVTEWGTCNANGDGPVDEASTAEWMAFIRRWELSHCNWAVSHKRESASIVRPGASVSGGWTEEDLTASGKFVRQLVRGWREAPPAAAQH